MITPASTAMPVIPPVQPENIPALLGHEKRWVGWWPGALKDNGKFDKFPVDPLTGVKINPLDPANWLTLPEALDACRRDMAKGVGFVLSDQHPITVDGEPRYVTALDFDRCDEKRMEEHEALWRELGKPYLELSPSGKGLHFFGLCDTPLRGGNAGGGREMYSAGRYITMTGVGARGTLRDITVGLVALEQGWWPDRAAQGANLSLQPVRSSRAETAEDVAAVLSMLDHVSSDTDYETWRNIIWAITSTGWPSAPRIVHQWSRRAPLRYDAAAVDDLLQRFDPSGGITLGTLIHHARQNGWAGHLTHSMESQPPLSLLPPPPPGNLLLTVAQLRQLPPTAYVVRGLLPARGLAAIYGEPGSGKSFLAIDLAHAIAMGRADWFGFPVLKSPVAYVALEGQGGIRKRMDAIEAHTKVACDAQLRFWCSALQLLDDKGVDVLAAKIVEELGTGAAVIIDTLNQASPGADENTSQDMGKIIAAGKRLADAVGGLVVFIHHAGKTRALGLRGHSSLNAAMDAVLEVVKEKAGHKWRVTKAKDDSGDVVRDFDLVRYTVGQDAFGPITSCAVQQTARVGTVPKAPIRGKHHKAAMGELRRLLPQPGQVLDYQSALRQVAAVLTTTKGKERDRAKEAIEALISGGHVSLTDGGLCLAD